MQESLTSVLELIGLAWWVEIATDSPRCIYYFGPFLTSKEAENEQPGFVQDLQQEGAQGIVVTIKRCKPSQLTIFDDEVEGFSNNGISPSFSSP